MAAALPAPVRVRRMTEGDLDEVVALQKIAFAHPWTAQMLRRELEHDWSTVLVALLDGPERVAGFIVYWLVHDEVHVLNVATHPEERRRGVARLLMLEAEAAGRARGAVLSTLEVRRSNAAAIALYESLGYRTAGERRRYYDDGEDAAVMTRTLGPARA